MFSLLGFLVKYVELFEFSFWYSFRGDKRNWLIIYHKFQFVENEREKEDLKCKTVSNVKK